MRTLLCSALRRRGHTRGLARALAARARMLGEYSHEHLHRARHRHAAQRARLARISRPHAQRAPWTSTLHATTQGRHTRCEAERPHRGVVALGRARWRGDFRRRMWRAGGWALASPGAEPRVRSSWAKTPRGSPALCLHPRAYIEKHVAVPRACVSRAGPRSASLTFAVVECPPLAELKGPRRGM